MSRIGRAAYKAPRAGHRLWRLAASASHTGDPCRLLELANSALLSGERDAELLVTAACIALQPRERRLSCALAGHPPPMWLDDGTPLTQQEPAFPLGVQDRIDCTASTSELVPGTGLVAYTDGLSEAHRRGGDLFGSERIGAVIARMRGAAPARVLEELRGAAEEFSGGRLRDDLCMIALRAS